MSLKVHRYGRIGYLLHIPAAEADDTRRKHPVILFLHGMGERGDDPNLLKNYGLPKVIDDQPDFPFIVIAPQCPADHTWIYDAELLMALLDHIIMHQFADERRVYLTGASMGGYGAWELGSQYPHRFAAVVPVCGVALSDPSAVCALKDMPVWALHGTDDPLVPMAQTQTMINALRDCGGDPLVTYVEGAGHEVGTTAYQDAKLFDWLRKQTLATEKQK
jgi:predicted peptidase